MLNMLDFQHTELADANILAVLNSINWWDPWIIMLMVFHLSITTATFVTRNRNNFQVVLFIFLLLLVYCSENINEIASNNWRKFSKRQYFDSDGLFISLVFCAPILFNCMIMIANWLYQSRKLMTELRLAQLRARSRSGQKTAITNKTSTTKSCNKKDH